MATRTHLAPVARPPGAITTVVAVAVISGNWPAIAARQWVEHCSRAGKLIPRTAPVSVR
jgi:hypothetical protein